MPTRNKLGSEPGLLFFCLGGLVVIADPIITSESPDTKTQPAYADRASETELRQRFLGLGDFCLAGFAEW
jgi:hypothetical protein